MKFLLLAALLVALFTQCQYALIREHHETQTQQASSALLSVYQPLPELRETLYVSDQGQVRATTEMQALPEAGTTRFVYALIEPAIELDSQFVKEALSVIACESRWWPDALGKAGERGFLQIAPIHFPRMERMGLNPEHNGDLLRYGQWLWERNGWKAWSCKPE